MMGSESSQYKACIKASEHVRKTSMKAAELWQNPHIALRTSEALPSPALSVCAETLNRHDFPVTL